MQLSQGCADVPSRLKIVQMVTLQKTFLSDIAGRSTAESDIKIPLNQSNRSQTNKVKLVEGIYACPHFLNVCPKSVYWIMNFKTFNSAVGYLSLAEFVLETEVGRLHELLIYNQIWKLKISFVKTKYC